MNNNNKLYLNVEFNTRTHDCFSQELLWIIVPKDKYQ